MKYDWIMDVLTDLRTFSEDNGLSELTEQLDQTCLVAATEIAQHADTPQGRADGNARSPRSDHQDSSATDNA